MPKITDIQIQKNNKTRANVYIDGEFAFGLEMLTVMKLGLKIGKEVSEQTLAEAVFDSDKSVALTKAVGYLSRAMKARRQMRDYLTGKGYSPRIISYVLEKLEEYRYVDDEAYAKLYVEQNSANKGERRIKQELQLKGVPREIIDSYCVVPSDLSEASAVALADKYMRNKPRDAKTAQKLQRYLLSRGYGFDTVNAIVRGLGADEQSDE